MKKWSILAVASVGVLLCNGCDWTQRGIRYEVVSDAPTVLMRTSVCTQDEAVETIQEEWFDNSVWLKDDHRLTGLFTENVQLDNGNNYILVEESDNDSEESEETQAVNGPLCVETVTLSDTEGQVYLESIDMNPAGYMEVEVKIVFEGTFDETEDYIEATFDLYTK